MEDTECPYRLSEFVLKDESKFSTSITVTHRPVVYLAHDSAVQTHTIAPALALFHKEDLAAPAKAFQKALARHGEGDYQGCITSCATAVESTIKVVAKQRAWSLKAKGIGGLTKSFIVAAGLPEKYSNIAFILAERRHNAGDAHGHEQIYDTPETEARFIIGLSASFIVFVASELNQKNKIRAADHKP